MRQRRPPLRRRRPAGRGRRRRARAAARPAARRGRRSGTRARRSPRRSRGARASARRISSGPDEREPELAVLDPLGAQHARARARPRRASSTSSPLRFSTSTDSIASPAPFGARLLRVLAVGLDDPLHELVADDVLVAEADERDPVDRRRGCPAPGSGPTRWSRGRSTCVMSPVTTTFEPKPRRVRNICICSGEVFCASSRMMKLSFSVRPRMNASGATSIVPRSM